MVGSDELNELDLVGPVDRSGGLSYTDSALRGMRLKASVTHKAWGAHVPPLCRGLVRRFSSRPWARRILKIWP